MRVDSPQMDLLSRHTHAIIDWASVVPADWHKELPVQPLVPRYFLNTDDDIMPVLLTLESLSDAHLKLLCDNLEDAETRPYMLMPTCLLHVDSGVHPDSLTHHLTSLLMLNGPNRDGAGRLLRYYYPSIFLHLLRILPPKRIRQLFGPVWGWSVPFQREWVALTPPEITGPIPQYWAVNEEQNQRIRRIGLINNVLTRYRDKTNQRWASVDAFHADAEKLDRNLLSYVRRYQLRVFNDQLLFGVHSLLYGENFHEHPKIQQLMQIVQKKGWDYAGESVNITDDDWREIKATQHPFEVTY